ncbi:MAG: SMC family ATPase [Thermodesulfobacteriota bacterium]
MIVEELRLDNFLSYKELSLNFELVDAVIITGENGSGKSSLIDAFLWALYGRARSSSIDDFVKLGSDGATVELQFSLNGDRYRVIRKRSLKTAKGKSELGFAVMNGDEWKSLGGSLTETQEAIERVLRMDYETLISSTVLRQGESGLFTKAPPNRRKQILSKILNLERYGELEKLARRDADALKGKEETIRLEVGKSQEVLATRVDTEKELRDRREHLASMNELIQSKEKEGDDLAGDIKALELEIQDLVSKKQKRSLLSNEVKELSVKRSGILAKIERFKKVLDKENDVRMAAEEEKNRLKDMESHESNLTVLEDRHGELENEYKEIEMAKLQLSKLESQVKMDEVDHANMVANARRDVERANRDVARLGEVPCSENAEYQKACKFIKDAFEVKAALPVLEMRLRKLEDPAWKPPSKEALDKLKDKTKDYDWQGKEIEVSKTTILAMKGRIATAREGLTKIREIVGMMPEIELAVEELPLLENEKKQVDTKMQTSEKELVALDQEISRYSDKVLTIENAKDRLKNIHAEVEGFSRHRDTTNQDIGRLEHVLATMEELKKSIEKLESEVVGIRDQRRVSEALEEAFRMIPVLIVENAIPFIEDEANEVLGKISSSGMQVRMETQRALKTSDRLAETLDIVIQDNDGERKYEMYSGGESFRVDIALRIGLSKLLAHRAGACLEILIIDEGWGVLDNVGIEQLKECLVGLSGEFKKILVISHIDLVKDMFPNRIEVTKGINGSEARFLN